MLTRIELQFFKCFELLRLPVAPLTLLTGLNASGKSSVLQVLTLLHQTMLEHEWSTRLALNGIGVRLGTTPDVVDEVFGRSSFGITLEDHKDVCDWAFEGTRYDMSMKVQHVSVNGRKTECPQVLRYLLPPDEREVAVSLAHRLRDLTYITAERIPPKAFHQLEDPHVIGTVGTRGEHAMSVLHWGRDKPVLAELALPNSPTTRLRQVEEHMRIFFPNFALQLLQTSLGNSVILSLRVSDDTRFYNPIHTGFGLTQVLPIVIAALSANKGDIILIENPEVHLHPAGQMQIGQFVAKVAQTGIQVFVETHSDHVLNGVRRAVKEDRLAAEKVAIHFFRPRTEGQTQVLSPVMDQSGNIDVWPDGFFDQFDKDANYFAGWGEI